MFILCNVLRELYQDHMARISGIVHVTLHVRPQ
jgi:hypothetical protein